jgi:adenylate cyclase
MTRSLRVRLLVAVAVLAAAVACLIEATDAVERLELSTVDARFKLRGERPPPSNLVVVGIDDKTFDELGERWPFSRNRFAKALETVDAAGPAVVVYDVQFTEQSDDPRADNRLIEASRAAGNAVFSTTETGEQGESNVFGGGEALAYARAASGNGLFPEDPGGVVRRIPAQIDGLDTLAVAAVRRLGGPVPFDGLAGRGGWIDFGGGAGRIPRVSFSDVIDGEVPPERFRDKIVVIGATAPSLQDTHPVSWPDGTMAGPEIHATAIETLLDGAPLRTTGEGDNLAIALALALLAPLLALFVRPVVGLAVSLAAGILYAIAAQLLFGAGWIVPVVAPLAGLAVGFVGTLLVHWLTATFERARTRDVFARFVPDTVVDQVLTRATEEGDPRLGGERMDATVLFSDLRGFTSFAEARDPEQVIDVLNRYLTAMSDAILDHHGTLVAYMGDGIMAVFGAPVGSPDHADQALAAARSMLERLEEFNAWIRERGHGDGFKMGIGLHSGPVMSGNVGSARRLEYAAIGDTTNTAARLESMTKGTPYQLFVGEPTHDRLRAAPDDLEFVSELEVRGRAHGIRVWGLREAPAPAHLPRSTAS